MLNSNRFLKWAGVASLIAMLIVGTWAVEQTNSQSVETQDFDPLNPSQRPDPTDIDIQIDGVSVIGEVFMIEGLENMTSVRVEGDELVPGDTTFPRLILHGVFDDIMRDWRHDIINGTLMKRDIDIDLNSNGTRRLRIEIHNAWPSRFTFPPLSSDGSTRYMERMEFVYTDFEVVD